MPATLNIEAIIAPMIEVHRSGENRSLQWRLKQLDVLERMVNENKDAFSNALFQDLHKNKAEFILTEFLVVQQEIKKFKRELPQWMKPIQVPSPAGFAPSFSEIQSVPLLEPGCLVIAPFNYPFCLSLLPFIGSIGGGNPCVLKPSELCQNLSSLFAKLIPKYFARGVFQVVEGGVDETTELMKQNWGLCSFTGSESVGRIIQQSAALTLTPTILELGGKSPTIISEDCPDDMDVICNRIVFGKLMNLGQTCISPDYVLCHESKLSAFQEEIVRAMERRLGENPRQDAKLARIVSEKHSQRHLNLLQEIEKTKGKVIFGGSKLCSVDKKYTAPTVIIEPSMESRLMQEEIFGPILPILSFSNDEEVISIVNKMKGTPLALYVFTKSKERYDKITARCPSGGIMRNDTVLHFAVPDLPFGGIGTSGIGRYQGKSSFDTFTHKKSSMYHPCHPAFEYWGLRYNTHKGGATEKILLSLIEYAPLIPVVAKCKGILLVLVILILAMITGNIQTLRYLVADALEKLASLLKQK